MLRAPKKSNLSSKLQNDQRCILWFCFYRKETGNNIHVPQQRNTQKLIHPCKRTVQNKQNEQTRATCVSMDHGGGEGKASAA